jgi:hypothetical protein
MSLESLGVDIEELGGLLNTIVIKKMSKDLGSKYEELYTDDQKYSTRTLIEYLETKAKAATADPSNRTSKGPLGAEEKHQDHQPVLSWQSPPRPALSAICPIIRLTGAANYCGWNCRKDMIERCKSTYASGASNHWGRDTRQHPTANAKIIHAFVGDITD